MPHLNRDSITKNNILSYLHSLYNTEFLDHLIMVPGARVFLFGGAIRDSLLERPWKEADIRVTLNLGWEEREKAVADALSNEVIEEKNRIEPLKLSILRFLPKGSKTNHAIDLSITPTFDDAQSDFTINALYLDLATGEVIDQFNGMADLEKGIIRTVKNPANQLKNEPHIIFRAIKASCQFGLEIENDTKAQMLANSQEARVTLDFVSSAENKRSQRLLVELFLANIFRGLAYNPEKYVNLLSECNLTKVMLSFIQDKTDEKVSLALKDNPFTNLRSDTFEANVSLFISYLASHFANSEIVFHKILRLFSLDSPMKYLDFEIDTTRLVLRKLRP